MEQLSLADGTALLCPHCFSDRVWHMLGPGPGKRVLFRCRSCHRDFQLTLGELERRFGREAIYGR